MSTVLLTGCSSGFGELAARRLADRGHVVFATMRAPEGRNADAADALEVHGREASGEIHVLELDVTDDASVRRAVAAAEERAGAPDALINNAGRMFLGITEAFTTEQLDEQIDVNVLGPHRVARAVLPGMRARGSGLMINVSSIAGRLVVPCGGVYHASKFALEALTESMRYELAPFGVEVVLVEPGPFGTNLFPSVTGPADEERVEAYGEKGREVFDTVIAALGGVIEDPDAPSDPALVVDTLVELVEAEPGERPFRSVVGVGFGTRGINEALEPHRQGVLGGLGMPGLDRVGT